MGQMNAPVLILKGVRQSAALVVDEDERHLIRAEIDRHREDVCDQKLRFSGTGHTGHQTVGPLPGLVEVQGKQPSVCADADGDGQGFHRVVLHPAAQRIQVLHPTGAEHLQKCHHIGQRIVGGTDHQLQPHNFPHSPVGGGVVAEIRFKILVVLACRRQSHQLRSGAQVDNPAALLWNPLKGGDDGHAGVLLSAQNPLQALHTLEQLLAQGQHHIGRLIPLPIPPVLIQHRFNLFAQVLADLQRIGTGDGKKADGPLVIPVGSCPTPTRSFIKSSSTFRRSHRRSLAMAKFSTWDKSG